MTQAYLEVAFVEQEMTNRRFNKQQRTNLYLASGGVCENCGAELGPGWHADHVEAWSRGGATDVVNGQALCPTCNLKKGSKMINKRPLRNWQREALDLYDQHQEKAFLVEACPAAGKSRFIAEVVQRELHKGKADAIVVVVPSKALRKQMANDFHEETGIELDPMWNGDGVPLVHGAFKGAVVTYQWIAGSNNAGLLRRHVSRRSVLVVLDEVHHAQDEKPWGDSLQLALEPATKILLTTGTPFTSNGNPIAFIRYDDQGMAITDYSYNYGKALTDGVVRALIFNHHQGEMEWESETGTVKATFADKLNKRDVGRRLRTAIHEEHDQIFSLLREGVNKIRELREDDPDAAMLVVAQDQSHAKKLAKRLRQELGVTPIVAVSEDGDEAAGAIKAFKRSQEQCIVAVNMISEGVNIPRIRVIVYATNVTTFLYFMQVMGRGMRTEPDHDDPTAWVFIPDDGRFRIFADKLMKECEEALVSREDRVRETNGGAVEQETLWFNPLSASFDNVVATVNGVVINAEELSLAATFKDSNPTLRGLGLSREHIATVMKAMGWNFTTGMQNYPTSSQISKEEIKTELPEHEKLSDLRAQNNKLIAALAYRRGIEFKNVNARLNKAVNIYTVQKCYDAGKLEKRRLLAKRWLVENIEPEAPFNG